MTDDDRDAAERYPDSLLRKTKAQLLDMLRESWIAGRRRRLAPGVRMVPTTTGEVILIDKGTRVYIGDPREDDYIEVSWQVPDTTGIRLTDEVLARIRTSRRMWIYPQVSNAISVHLEEE